MGEEVRIVGAGIRRDDDDNRVSEWEAGLPNFNDLTPLSQPLIPPELASAFRISPEPSRSLLDVNRASQTTLASLRTSNDNNFNNFINKSSIDETTTSDTNRDHVAVMVMDIDDTADLTREESDSQKTRRITEFSSSAAAATEETDDGSARTLKRPRLVWTPQLHKRFVDVVAHLGIKQAVPKTIMQLMNVEGLTRENVASHLQKYRLYLKRMMQGLSSEEPSPSDNLFASTPVPHSLHESPGGGGAGIGSVHGHSNGGNSSSNEHMGMPIPMHYPPPPNGGARMVPIQLIGMSGPTPGGFPGYESHHHHHHYGMMQHQRDWSGNKFGSVAPYPHNITPNDK